MAVTRLLGHSRILKSLFFRKRFPVTRLLWISKEKIILKKKYFKSLFPGYSVTRSLKNFKVHFFSENSSRLLGYPVTRLLWISKEKIIFKKKYFKSLFPGYLVTRSLKNFKVHFFQKTLPGYSVTLDFKRKNIFFKKYI